MLTVEVYHSVMHPRTHMATVKTDTTDIGQALEYAFRWTQNLNGSWSKPGTPDSNPNVTVRAPLPIWDGMIYGHRSSMVGDEFVVGGVSYYVASHGFLEATSFNRVE